MVLEMVQGVLSDRFDVSAVNDGEKVFTIMDRITPDLILLDLRMPKMDGLEVLSRLKANQEYKNIPVIFLTGVTDEYSEIKCFQAGAEDYICKPFSATTLTTRIDRVLSIQQYHKF